MIDISNVTVEFIHSSHSFRLKLTEVDDHFLRMNTLECFSNPQTLRTVSAVEWAVDVELQKVVASIIRGIQAIHEQP